MTLRKQLKLQVLGDGAAVEHEPRLHRPAQVPEGRRVRCAPQSAACRSSISTRDRQHVDIDEYQLPAQSRESPNGINGLPMPPPFSLACPTTKIRQFSKMDWAAETAEYASVFGNAPTSATPSLPKRLMVDGRPVLSRRSSHAITSRHRPHWPDHADVPASDSGSNPVAPTHDARLIRQAIVSSTNVQLTTLAAHASGDQARSAT